jgi:hypothetical protein
VEKVFGKHEKLKNWLSSALGEVIQPGDQYGCNSDKELTQYLASQCSKAKAGSSADDLSMKAKLTDALTTSDTERLRNILGVDQKDRCDARRLIFDLERNFLPVIYLDNKSRQDMMLNHSPEKLKEIDMIRLGLRYRIDVSALKLSLICTQSDCLILTLF